jgi:hypothetical protein
MDNKKTLSCTQGKSFTNLAVKARALAPGIWRDFKLSKKKRRYPPF